MEEKSYKKEMKKLLKNTHKKKFENKILMKKIGFY